MRERRTELIRVALIGTGRQPLGEPALPRLAAGPPEVALLAEAAALALAERAGALLPVVDEAPGEPAPAEACPRVPVAAARELDLVLAAEPALVPEWLRLCAAAGLRSDERSLPGLLEHGRTHPEERPAVLAVLGARGRWLASLEPGWAWVTQTEPPAEAWQTGGRGERLGFFAALRRRDPDAARALLSSGFAREAPEDRAELVALCAVHLAPADEPFLEAALDDRRKEVRLAAARVLHALPTARLGARMAVRARGVVRGGHVTLPDPPDAAALRDGLETVPPRGEGPRAFHLRQLVSATPLATWGPPEQALAALARSEWREVVVLGWALATARQRDPAWAEALLAVTLEVPELLRHVAPARREAVALAALARAEASEIPHVLRQLERPLGERVSRTALTAVRNTVLGAEADADAESATAGQRARVQTARVLLGEVVIGLAPTLLGPLVQALSPPRPTLWHAALSATLPVALRRLAIHRSFKEP